MGGPCDSTGDRGCCVLVSLSRAQMQNIHALSVAADRCRDNPACLHCRTCGRCGGDYLRQSRRTLKLADAYVEVSGDVRLPQLNQHKQCKTEPQKCLTEAAHGRHRNRPALDGEGAGGDRAVRDRTAIPVAANRVVDVRWAGRGGAESKRNRACGAGRQCCARYDVGALKYTPGVGRIGGCCRRGGICAFRTRSRHIARVHTRFHSPTRRQTERDLSRTGGPRRARIGRFHIHLHSEWYVQHRRGGLANVKDVQTTRKAERHHPHYKPLDPVLHCVQPPKRYGYHEFNLKHATRCAQRARIGPEGQATRRPVDNAPLCCAGVTRRNDTLTALAAAASG